MTDVPQRFRRWALLFLADALVVYVAFVGALVLRTGRAVWLPSEVGYEATFAITALVSLAALLVARGYTQAPWTMRLGDYARLTKALAVGGILAVGLDYLAGPFRMPMRGIVAGQWLLTVVGVLGVRIAARLAVERWPKLAGDLLPVPLTLHHLFDRPDPTVDRPALVRYLAPRTVLVTGAGGSVGSELARQLAAFGPARLVLVDIGELGLFNLEPQLAAYDGDLVLRIADLRNEQAVQRLLTTYQPDVVLHAAAYKHVPLMEAHPREAFANNTLATARLVRACEAAGVEQFVFISTDKAVAPTSVLGTTKRLAEWAVRAGGRTMRRKAVRFGNVFGSQGSVVPRFVQQIEAGGPVTVTHPEMTRYFMSAEEAATLVLHTLVLDEAPLFLLRMGEPMRIVDLAERLIRHLAPGQDIAIEFTGIRPGEKLHEQLWEPDERPTETRHPAILGLTSTPPLSHAELDTLLHDLAAIDEDEALRTALQRATQQHA
ncbi:MAG: polysaccharide biosynthesis protein [Bacteroidota bacterium]